MKKYARLSWLLCLLLAACSLAGPAPAETPLPAETDLPAQATPSTPTQQPTPAATPTPGPVTLRVWVPPQFDPSAETPAGKLLNERLETFSRRRPGVSVEVRVKVLAGAGGLLDTLTTAGAAAPLALPDLVALPHLTLETAVIKGLLYPYDQHTSVMDDPDWFDFSRQLASVQNGTFGLPFAGDALVLVYRPAAVGAPPADWAAALSMNGPLAFPAADPQALFTLTQYQAAGGAARDDQGRPVLEAAPLESVLNFYQQASTASLMPYWLTQYGSDEQAWQAFQEGSSNMVVTSMSRFLNNLLADTEMALLPTPDGAPYTSGTGWVWALASPQPERQELAAQLGEFLVESSFIAGWTDAANLLPTRPSALSNWSSPSFQSLARNVIHSARLIPSEDVLASLGPALQAATVDVLKQQQVDPRTAAQSAVEKVVSP